MHAIGILVLPIDISGPGVVEIQGYFGETSLLAEAHKGLICQYWLIKKMANINAQDIIGKL